MKQIPGSKKENISNLRITNANILAMESNATGVFNAAGGNQIIINERVKIITQQIGKEDI